MGNFSDRYKKDNKHLFEEEERAVEEDVLESKRMAEATGTGPMSRMARGATHGLIGSMHGFRGLANQIMGDRIGAEQAFQDMAYREKRSEQFQAETSFLGGDGKKSALQDPTTFLLETLGQLAPSMGEALVSGAVGGLIGGALVPAPDPTDVAAVPAGFFVGLFGRKAVKAAIKEYAETLISGGIKKKAAQKIARSYFLMNKNYQRTAIREFLPKVMKQAGAALGVWGSTTVMEAGGMAGDLNKAGIEAPLTTLFLGSLSGASELYLGNVPAGIAAAFAPAKRASIRNTLKKFGAKAAAKAYLNNISEEAGQEGVQEFLSLLNQELNDPNFEITDAESFTRLVEATAAGAVGGLVGGTTTSARGLLGNMTGKNKVEKTAPQEPSDLNEGEGVKQPEVVFEEEEAEPPMTTQVEATIPEAPIEAPIEEPVAEAPIEEPVIEAAVEEPVVEEAPSAPAIDIPDSVPKLPRDLEKAAPRYSYGNKQFTLDFDNDVDKALYIAAQKTKSKRDADFRKFLTDQGLTDEEIDEVGQGVRNQIKSIAKNIDGGQTIFVPKVYEKKQTKPKPKAKPEAKVDTSPVDLSPIKVERKKAKKESVTIDNADEKFKAAKTDYDKATVLRELAEAHRKKGDNVAMAKSQLKRAAILERAFRAKSANGELSKPDAKTVKQIRDFYQDILDKESQQKDFKLKQEKAKPKPKKAEPKAEVSVNVTREDIKRLISQANKRGDMDPLGKPTTAAGRKTAELIKELEKQIEEREAKPAPKPKAKPKAKPKDKIKVPQWWKNLHVAKRKAAAESVGASSVGTATRVWRTMTDEQRQQIEDEYKQKEAPDAKEEVKEQVEEKDDREAPSAEPEVLEKQIKTKKGTVIKRYKDNVGKKMGSKIYVHKDYAGEFVPEGVFNDAKEALRRWYWSKYRADSPNYNAVMYDEKTGTVRFDMAPDFDTASEPTVGTYYTVDKDGMVERGSSDNVWHHKWLWVKDGYKGFDVEASKNRSREWVQKIEKPSGSPKKWRQQQIDAGINAEVFKEEILTEPATSLRELNKVMHDNGIPADVVVKRKGEWLALVGDNFSEDILEKEVRNLNAKNMIELYERMQKSAPNVETKKVAPKKDFGVVGESHDGAKVYEDPNGYRQYIAPMAGKWVKESAKNRKARLAGEDSPINFLTKEEIEAKKKPEAKPEAGQIIEEKDEGKYRTEESELKKAQEDPDGIDRKGQIVERVQTDEGTAQGSRSTTASQESRAQIAAIYPRKTTNQTIVTIKEAQDWLEKNGFPRIAPRGFETELIGKVSKNEAFQKLSVFDKIRILAQLERAIRGQDYLPFNNVTQNAKAKGSLGVHQNEKVKGSDIWMTDPVRGCDNFCYECYGVAMSARASVTHQHPVFATLDNARMIKPHEYLRVGEIGDPSKSWEWSQQQVSGLVERSANTYGKVSFDKNVFAITKLISTAGFDGTFRNLHVTLDPMYPEHMQVSMDNILSIKASFPETRIAVRIRTVQSNNAELMGSQQLAIDFARDMGFPILETKMRFRKNVAFDVLELDQDRYRRVGNQYVPKASILEQSTDRTKKDFVCNEKGGDCPVCMACLKVTVRQKKAWLEYQKERMADVYVPLDEQADFDVVGGSNVMYRSQVLAVTQDERQWLLSDNAKALFDQYHKELNVPRYEQGTITVDGNSVAIEESSVEDLIGFADWLSSRPASESESVPARWRTGVMVNQLRQIDGQLQAAPLTISPARKRKMLRMLKKMLGDSVKLDFVDRLHAGGLWRMGRYYNRLITIAENKANPEDTLMHEAVHAAMDTILTPSDRQALLDVFNGNEEALAEGVIRYAKSRQGFTGKAKAIVEKFLRAVRKLFGTTRDIDRVNAFYSDLLGGDLASRVSPAIIDEVMMHDVAMAREEDEDLIPAPKETATTQVANTKGTYVKAARILRKSGAKEILDYGAGLGLGADAVADTLGFPIETFEPNAERWKGQRPTTYTKNAQIRKQYDGIMLLNVLNVVPKPIRDMILIDVFDKLKPNGVAVIVTRKYKSDIDTVKNFEAGPEDKSVYVLRKQGGKQVKVFQKGFDGNELVDYTSEMLEDEATVDKVDLGANGAIVRRKVFDSSYRTDLSERPLGFYSPLARALNELNQETFAPDQLRAVVAKIGGVKEEIDDLDFYEWLDGVDGKVTKDQALEFVRNGGVQLQEIVSGVPSESDIQALLDDEIGENMSRDDAIEYLKLDEPNITKYADYTTENSENYREVLLTLPSSDPVIGMSFDDYVKNYHPSYNNYTDTQKTITDNMWEKERVFGRDDSMSYKSSHWDELNVLAHLRLSDQTNFDGDKILMVEEIQSDWHQEGRKEGYRHSPAKRAALNEKSKAAWDKVRSFYSGLPDHMSNYQESIKISNLKDPAALAAVKEARAIEAEINSEVATLPNAPFKKSWSMLAFKRALAMAVDQGYDSIAWTTGDMQAERYDLSKQIDSVRITNRAAGWTIDAKKNGVNVLTKEGLTDSELSDTVGKDLADKAIGELTGPQQNKVYSGVDLKVGGEGMKAFYDKILPSSVKKYVKKLDKSATIGSEVIDIKNTLKYKVTFDNGNFVIFRETEEQAKELVKKTNELGKFTDAKYEEVTEEEIKTEVWSLSITPTIRAKVANGQPMYRTEAEQTDPLATAEWFENSKEAITNFFGRLVGRGDLGTLIRSLPVDENKKLDITQFDRTFRTISHYNEKVPSLQKLFKAGMRLKDDKHLFGEAVFGAKEELLKAIRGFASSASEEWSKLQDYLWKRDADAVGYTVRPDKVKYVLIDTNGRIHAEGGGKAMTFDSREAAKEQMDDYWRKHGHGDQTVPTIISIRRMAPSWNVYDQNQQLVASYDGRTDPSAERKAWTHAFMQESADYIKDGGTSQAAAILRNVRMINMRMYDQLVGEAEQMVTVLTQNGLPIPVITEEDGSTINVFDMLQEMGDRRGHYMPRMREVGRYVMRAEKTTGTDGPKRIRKSFLFEKQRALEAAKLKADGYTITFLRDNRPAEDVYLDASLVALNDLIQNALGRMDTEKIGAASLKSLGLEGRWVEYEKKDGTVSKDFLISGAVRNSWEATQLKEIFKAVRYGDEPDYRIPNADSNIESEIAKALYFYKHGVAEPSDALAETFVKQIADIVHSRGSRARKVSRSEATGEDVWQGYEKDAIRALSMAGKGVAGGTAKRRMAKEMQSIIMGVDESWHEYRSKISGFDKMSGEERKEVWLAYKEMVEDRRIDSALQKNAYGEAISYSRDMLRNEETHERVFGAIKGIAALKHLSGIAPAVVNMTALATTVPAAMAHYGGVKINKVFRLLPRGANNYRKYMLYFMAKRKSEQRGVAFDQENPLTGEDKWLYDEITERGWDEALMNTEATQALKSFKSRAVDFITEKALFAFSVTERINRASTIAAGYYALREQGLNQNEALEKAKYISDKAHGTYGKENLPSLARGPSLGAQAFRSFYMYKTFTHNYLDIAGQMGWNALFGEDKKKAAKSFVFLILSPAIIGGAGSTILTPILSAMAKGLFDYDDPEEELYRLVESEWGAGADTLARTGLAGMFNFNLNGSLSIDPTDLPTSLKDVVGAPYSLGEDLVLSAKSIQRGDIVKAAERLSPRIISGFIRGPREAIEGVTTTGNAPVYFGDERLKADWYDMVLRMASFNPAKISIKKTKQWKDRKVESEYRDQKRDFYAKVRRFALNGGSKAEWGELLMEAEEYNAKVGESSFKQLSYITPAAIKAQLTRLGKPEKRERIRSGEETREDPKALKVNPPKRIK